MVFWIHGITALLKCNIPNEKYVVVFNEKRYGCVEKGNKGVQKEDVDVHFNETTKTVSFVEPTTIKIILAIQSTIDSTSNYWNWDKSVVNCQEKMVFL